MSRVRTSLLVVTAFAALMSLAGCAPDDAPAARAQLPSVSAAASAPPSTGTATSSPEPTAPSPPPAQLKEVEVVLVTAGADTRGIYSSGLVPDVLEQGGSCVMTASNGIQELTARIDAVAATSAMNCGLLTIQAPSGEWELTLSYSSESSEGHSETITVTVP